MADHANPASTAILDRSTPRLPQQPGGNSAVPRCIVVMYHYVHDQFPAYDSIPHQTKGVHALSVSQFEQQLDFLTSRLEPIDWATLSLGLRNRSPLPDQSFLLTFDDGLREHAEIVLPILERRGLKGIFFVPGCVLSTPRMLTAHAVHLLLEAIGVGRLADEIGNELSGMATYISLNDDEAAQALKVYHYETPKLALLKFLINMKLPLATRASVIRRLFERHVGSHEEWAARWYLTTNQVREIHALGHTIGGHSFAHEPYGRLDEAALSRDVNRSATALRDILGPGERPFAYPFGSTHPDAAKFLGAAGFGRAFGTASEWLVRESPATNLPRVDAIHVETKL